MVTCIAHIFSYSVPLYARRVALDAGRPTTFTSCAAKHDMTMVDLAPRIDISQGSLTDLREQGAEGAACSRPHLVRNSDLGTKRTDAPTTKMTMSVVRY